MRAPGDVRLGGVLLDTARLERIAALARAIADEADLRRALGRVAAAGAAIGPGVSCAIRVFDGRAGDEPVAAGSAPGDGAVRLEVGIETASERLGALVVHFPAETRPTAGDRAMVELLAAHATLAIGSARARGQMVSGVAHDFNNLLAVMLGRAQLLLCHTREPRAREWLRAIERAAQDGARMVRRLQRSAAIRRDPPFVAVDPNDVARAFASVRPMRCLVVDDQDGPGAALADLLRQDGHHVILLRDGRAAIARFRAEPFDVVFTDLAMPGFTGWQVARAVKAIAPRVPTYLLSGSGVEVSPEEASRRGVDQVLTKPLGLEQLRGALARAAQMRLL